MRLTQRRLALLGLAILLAGVAIPVGAHIADDTSTTVQSPAAAPIEARRTSQDSEREAQAKRIAAIRAKYGVHFDHPANKDVTDPAKLLPYTNVWADVEFMGQDARPVVKTHGDVKVSISTKPRKITRPNSDTPGTTTTLYVWDLTVTFGDNVTYYKTMHNDNRGEGDSHSVRGWSAFIGDNDGKPIGQTATDYVADYLIEHVIYTATDPTQPREDAMDDLPVTWDELATRDMHLPD